tara:strand:+ start:1086 stop:2021 length:936 start_codon:yes stop_codon:yes gene_type:complete
MKEYEAAFIKSLLNSIRPEFMDSERFDDASLSPEFIGTLRRVADYYYSSDAVTKKRMSQFSGNKEIVDGLSNGQVNYEMVDELLGLDNYFKDEEYQGSGTDIKMILGSFKVNRQDDGSYRITDIYDFSNENDYFRKNFPAVTEYLDDLGVEVDNNAFEVMGGAYQTATTGSFYPIARALGETFMPDDRSPEEGGSTLVDFTIPKEDEVLDIPMPSGRPEEMMLQVENYRFPTDPMDADRKNFLDKMLNFLIPSAEADELDTQAVDFIGLKSGKLPEFNEDMARGYEGYTEALTKEGAVPRFSAVRKIGLGE